jgi:N-acetylneuraminic acid mutarotase
LARSLDRIRRVGTVGVLVAIAACTSDEDESDASSEVAPIEPLPSMPSDGTAPEATNAGDQGLAEGAPPIDLTGPAPGEYAERAALLAPNSEMAVAEAAGEIYVLGGYPSSRDVQATVQVYTPATNRWRFAAPMPLPTHHPVAIGVDALLYSLGGQLEGDVNTDRAFVLDTVADTWTELAPLPTARGGGAVARIGALLYVVGGRPPAGNAFEVYDTTNDSWAVLPSLPQAFAQRNHLIAVAIADKIYVAGGRYDGGGFASPMTDSLDVYDPASATWSSAAPMLRPRGGINGVAALGCFYVWGGEGQGIGEPNDVFPDHDVYDPQTNTWAALPPLPTPVHGVTGSVFLDGLLYMPGGGTASGGNSGSVIHQVFRVERSCDGTLVPDVLR